MHHTIQTAQEAVRLVASGDNVFIQGAAATPQALTDALAQRAAELRGVRLFHIHTEGHAPLVKPEHRDAFFDYSFFIGENVRQAVQENRADYIPVLLSELPDVFRMGVVPLDVALVSVSPPDQHGFVSLGVSVDVALAAVTSAKKVIGQINRFMPRTNGDGVLHVRDFTALVQHDQPLPTGSATPPSEAEQAVGKHLAALIPDGATLQMGIGALPNAVLANLTHHKDLGVHTEMFSDGLVPLIESGVVNNHKKVVLPGRTVTSFLMGSQQLYDFVDNNPAIVMKDMSWVNAPTVIARNPKVVAINSALEIDLTGQVCADSLGTKMYSGVGGQADFMLGAAHSQGGFPVIAICARTPRGLPKISPTLRPGAGVTTTRAQVHWVVTEFGAVNLRGKSLSERARLLISIAHPDDREALARAAYERWGAMGRTDEPRSSVSNRLPNIV